jgi:hypothetical protein
MSFDENYWVTIHKPIAALYVIILNINIHNENNNILWNKGVILFNINIV